MKRKHIIPIVILVIACAGWYGFSLYTEGPRDLSTEKADISMSASQLLTDFLEDEAVANENYLDKIITVSGAISSIERGTPTTIILDTGDIMSLVSCEMADENVPTDLMVGSTIKIKGQCTGFLSDVIMVKCIIE